MPELSRTVEFESISEDNTTRIKNLRTLIYNIEVAIDALVQGGHRSYELNTGQTTQRVTRENLNELYDLRKNLISELETRLATENINRPVVTVIPEW